MGAIVANSSKKPEPLIDGQQRLATISLLMCVIRDVAKESGDAQLSLTIAQRYLGSLNLRTRKIDSKLTLNETNNQFYQDNIVEPKSFEYLRKLANKRSLDKSNKLLIEAYLHLHKRVKERILQIGDVTKALIQIEECIKDKFIAIFISVADEANAYLIFETLNDRGLELSVADLLKNYLFSKASGRLQEVQNRWREINFVVGKFELTKFIRYYWLSNYGRVREKDLYRTITNQVRNQSEVLELVKHLRESAEVYGAFEDPQSSVWNFYTSDFKNDIQRLGLFQVSQCYSILLAAKESLPDTLFQKVLRMIVILSFRYTVICAYAPSELENAYSDTAKYIRKQKPNNVKAIFEHLKELYISDKDFSQKFAEKALSKRNARLARYILIEINNFYRGDKELVTNPNETEVNLEHILPQKPDLIWVSEFSGVDPEQYIDRIGNMTLLDSSFNREVGNTSFQDKCSTVFSNSVLGITKEIVNYSTWGPKQIEERQKKMAKAACQIWRLDY